jgi:hypothetical protein
MTHFDDYYPKFCSWVGYDNPINILQIQEKAALDRLVEELRRTKSLDIATEIWKRINQKMLIKGSMQFSADPKLNVVIKEDFRTRIEEVQSEEESNVIARDLLLRYTNFYYVELDRNFGLAADAKVQGQDKKQFIGAEGKFVSLFTRMNNRLSASEVIMLEDGPEAEKRKKADVEFSRMSDATAWDYLYSLTYFSYTHYYFGRPDRPIQPMPLAAPSRDIMDPDDVIGDVDRVTEQLGQNQQMPPPSSPPPEPPTATMPILPFQSPPPESPTHTTPEPPEYVQASSEPPATAEQPTLLNEGSDKEREMSAIRETIKEGDIAEALNRINNLRPTLNDSEFDALLSETFQYCMQNYSLHGVTKIAEYLKKLPNTPKYAVMFGELRGRALEIMEDAKLEQHNGISWAEVDAAELFKFTPKEQSQFKQAAITGIASYIRIGNSGIRPAAKVAKAFDILFATDLDLPTKRALIKGIKRLREEREDTKDIENDFGIIEADFSEYAN